MALSRLVSYTYRHACFGYRIWLSVLMHPVHNVLVREAMPVPYDKPMTLKFKSFMCSHTWTQTHATHTNMHTHATHTHIARTHRTHILHYTQKTYTDAHTHTKHTNASFPLFLSPCLPSVLLALLVSNSLGHTRGIKLKFLKAEEQTSSTASGVPWGTGVSGTKSMLLLLRARLACAAIDVALASTRRTQAPLCPTP